jgi:hypothetical protein
MRHAPRLQLRHGQIALVLATTLAMLASLLAVELIGSPARAWKPYTHTWSADLALVDAADGSVEVAGGTYPLDERVAAALLAAPEQYRAGVIGPDAFPDLVMGQSVVHPGTEPGPDGVPTATTGDWLVHVLDEAWDAQEDPRYTALERQQVLAFAYGFLTHAAGDVWAHTFVNEYAEGVFPALEEVASDAEAAAVALRHIVVEGYVGEVTRDFDAHPDREPVEGGVSDDSTPRVGLAAPPDLFVWETFVERPRVPGGRFGGRAFADAPANGQPTAERGPLIGGFYGLHDSLLRTAITPAGKLPWSKSKVRRKVAQCATVGCRVRKVAEQAGRRYALEWSEDVAAGLERWGRVGEAFVLGLFEPAVRREAQDDLCRNDGPEDSATRRVCEEAVSTIDTMLWFLQDERYLTTQGPRIGSMLGAPDRFLKAWDRFRRVMRFVEDRLDFLVPQPLAELVTRAEEWLGELVNDAISKVLGFDLEVWFDALRSPGTYLDGTYGRDLPGSLSVFNDRDLFPEDARERVDALLGLDTDLDERGKHPPGTELDLDTFSPLANTAVLSRLVLLDGAALDDLLTDLLGRPVATYSAGTGGDPDRLVRRNVMTWSLGGGEPWLRNIDSDHAWRRDGQPIWCTPTLVGSCEAESEAVPRDAALDGGTGTMPLWESCVLRPAFRTLFADWQRKGPFDPFPDYGDAPSGDLVNDPAPPESSLAVVSGARSGGFVAPGTVLRVDAEETDDRGRVFAPEDLVVRVRVGSEPLVSGPPGTTVTLPSRSGPVEVRHQGGDPCHPVDEPKGGLVTYDVDAAAPVQRCGLPNKVTSAESWSLDWEVTDSGAGVGAASTTVSDVGSPGQTAVVPRGGLLSAYDLGPGYHAYRHDAVDLVGNASVLSECGVFVTADGATLRANLDQALARGDVTPAAYDDLRPPLHQAAGAVLQGDAQGESSGLQQLLDLLAQLPGVDPDLRDRMSAHAKQRLAEL